MPSHSPIHTVHCFFCRHTDAVRDTERHREIEGETGRVGMGGEHIHAGTNVNTHTHTHTSLPPSQVSPRNSSPE
jgi:hypothetical protein